MGKVNIWAPDGEWQNNWDRKLKENVKETWGNTLGMGNAGIISLRKKIKVKTSKLESKIFVIVP